MAKRFISTELFDDEWFCNLSKDCKIFFIYFITKCDHAGILKLNKKLCEFQTGLKSLQTVIKELSNCLITVKENVYFMPKYIKFQYPNFPKSNVMQQFGAINILKEYNLWNKNLNSYVTVNKELINSYDNDNDNKDNKDNNKLTDKETFKIFWEQYHNITKILKTDKNAAFKYWKSLNLTEQQKAYAIINIYYNSIEDKKYIKKARTYLNDKNFNDEFKNTKPPPRGRKIITDFEGNRFYADTKEKIN